MIVYTCQISHWRRLDKDKYFVLDTTVKTGDKVFAPTWELVLDYKCGEINEDEYAFKYRNLMITSFHSYNDRWRDLFASDKPIILLCYCPPDSFCHRLLLIDILKEIATIKNIDFIYKGELSKESL